MYLDPCFLVRLEREWLLFSLKNVPVTDTAPAEVREENKNVTGQVLLSRSLALLDTNLLNVGQGPTASQKNKPPRFQTLP